MSRTEVPSSNPPQGTREQGGDAHEEAETLVRYNAIHQHAELELELAGRGEVERLEQLGVRWAELTQGLPARPPTRALPILERAKLIHERTRIELYRVRDRLVVDMSTNMHAKRAAEGYGGRAARRPSLDRSA